MPSSVPCAPSLCARSSPAAAWTLLVFSVFVGLQKEYFNKTMVSVYLLVHQNKYMTRFSVYFVVHQNEFVLANNLFWWTLLYMHLILDSLSRRLAWRLPIPSLTTQPVSPGRKTSPQAPALTPASVRAQQSFSNFTILLIFIISFSFLFL